MSRFLLHDRDFVLERLRIMGANLDIEAILKRRDDPSARGVVLGIRARDEDHVDRQANLVAFDLDVFLFHQVEQPHLHFLGQVGQFVDGEDAAIGARDESVMDRFLVGEVAPLGHLDRIDLADQIRHRDVGRRELFGVAALALDPCDLGRVALLRHELHASPANRRERIVVDLAARDRGAYSSSSAASERMIRDFACPRSPSRIM